MTAWLSKEPEPGKLNQVFNISGKHYYFLNDFTEDTTIQAFVDMLQIYSSVPSFWHAAPGILAAIIRPVKHIKYDFTLNRLRQLKGREKYNKNNYIVRVILEEHKSENIDAYASELKSLKVSDVSSIAFFLNNLFNELLSQILNNYSKKQNNPLLAAKIKELQTIWNKITNETSDGMKLSNSFLGDSLPKSKN
ncbi:MAG: hypothetical protein U0Y08_14975 [Bacteroidia bacterium]